MTASYQGFDSATVLQIEIFLELSYLCAGILTIVVFYRHLEKQALGFFE